MYKVVHLQLYFLWAQHLNKSRNVLSNQISQIRQILVVNAIGQKHGLQDLLRGNACRTGPPPSDQRRQQTRRVMLGLPDG